MVIRSGDGIDDLKRKVRIATILGTLQATLTNFRYLGKKWQDNTEEEALLGVSLTGIMDHSVLSGSFVDTWGVDGEEKQAIVEGEISRLLTQLKEVAIDTNKEWAERLGINPSTAITCVKPSGTVSQLVDSASGIHPRYSPYYIRTVRADKKDPLARVMKEAGFPCEDDVTKPDSTWVFSFPVQAPSGSVFRDDRTALEQLGLWLTYQRYWCEHKPSITVYVKEHEWPEVGAWVWQHFDEVSGVSFLPHTEHTYRQAPYQEINKSEFDIMVSKMPEFDFNFTEEYDSTVSSQTLACSGGACELVDLGEG